MSWRDYVKHPFVYFTLGALIGGGVAHNKYVWIAILVYGIISIIGNLTAKGVDKLKQKTNKKFSKITKSKPETNVKDEVLNNHMLGEYYGMLYGNKLGRAFVTICNLISISAGIYFLVINQYFLATLLILYLAIQANIKQGLNSVRVQIHETKR